MTCMLRPKSNELESRSPEWIAKVVATARVGKKRKPKGTKRNRGQPGHTVLGLTRSMVASFRGQGPGAADIGRVKRRDF